MMLHVSKVRKISSSSHCHRKLTFQHDSYSTPPDTSNIAPQIELLTPPTQDLPTTKTFSDQATDFRSFPFIPEEYYSDVYTLETMVDTSELAMSFPVEDTSTRPGSDLDNYSESLISEDSTGFHVQTEGSVIQYYCQL